MQTKRDYLVGLGLAKAGRGKFSNAAKAALVEAEAKGVKFSDGEPIVKSVKATGDSKPAPVEAANTPYLTQDEYRFPEAEYRAVANENGKKVVYSLRECCNTCKVSLVNHMCEFPTILGGIRVTIEKTSR